MVETLSDQFTQSYSTQNCESFLVFYASSASVLSVQFKKWTRRSTRLSYSTLKRHLSVRFDLLGRESVDCSQIRPGTKKDRKSVSSYIITDQQ